MPAGDELAAAKSGALFRVLEAGAPGFPIAVFAAIGPFAVVNSALINMLMASRLLYGMSNERILPRTFGTVRAGRRRGSDRALRIPRHTPVRPAQQLLVAGILLAVGAVLWVVNRLPIGRVEVDAERPGKS